MLLLLTHLHLFNEHVAGVQRDKQLNNTDVNIILKFDFLCDPLSHKTPMLGILAWSETRKQADKQTRC